MSYGWAYGSAGDKLKNRKVALGVSAGIKKENYSEQGRYRYTLEQMLVSFETTFLYCKANYRSLFAVYGNEDKAGENVPGSENEQSDNQLINSAQDYLHFIDNM